MTEALARGATDAATPTFAQLVMGSVRRLGEPLQAFSAGAPFILALVGWATLPAGDPIFIILWSTHAFTLASIARSGRDARDPDADPLDASLHHARWLDLAARYTVNATLLTVASPIWKGVGNVPLVAIAGIAWLALSAHLLNELAWNKWTAPAVRGPLRGSISAFSMLWFALMHTVSFVVLFDVPPHILNLGAALATTASTCTVVAAVIVTRRRLRT